MGAAGRHGDALLLCEGEGAGAHLVSEELERLHRRSHEDEAGVGAGRGERGVLGQEAVAGVDCVAVALLRSGDHLFNIEIGGGAASA